MRAEGYVEEDSGVADTQVSVHTVPSTTVGSGHDADGLVFINTP